MVGGCRGTVGLLRCVLHEPFQNISSRSAVVLHDRRLIYRHVYTQKTCYRRIGACTQGPPTCLSWHSSTTRGQLSRITRQIRFLTALLHLGGRPSCSSTWAAALAARLPLAACTFSHLATERCGGFYTVDMIPKEAPETCQPQLLHTLTHADTR